MEERKKIQNKPPQRHIYDLFVTDQIVFPPHVVCFMYDKVIKGCALEIRCWDEDTPELIALQKAVSFDPTLTPFILDIPEKFREK